MASIEDALLELWKREIGINLTSFPGIGFTVKLGDDLNGFKADREFGPPDLHDIGGWILKTVDAVKDWSPRAMAELEVVAAVAKDLGMQPYRQAWPHRVTMEDWLALAPPDVPPLPWIADNGAEICSFVLDQIEVTGDINVIFYDAHGTEVAWTALAVEHRAIEATAVAVGGRVDELTFLPVAIRPTSRTSLSSTLGS